MGASVTFLISANIAYKTLCLEYERLSGLHLSLVVVHRIHDHDPLACDDKHRHVEPVVREAVDPRGHFLAGREALLGQAQLPLLPLLSAGVGEDPEDGGENQEDRLHAGDGRIASGGVRRWRGDL